MIATDRPIVIGETAFHHEGDKDFLLNLVDMAGAMKLDAIKFHLLLDLDDYMVADHTAKATLQKLSLPETAWTEVLNRTRQLGLDAVFLCNDVKSMDWVMKQDQSNILAIEIHATGINDIFLLERAASFGKTVILGTGGSTIDEINFAVSLLKTRGKTDIFLMHGFQNYPTRYEDVILSKMEALHSLFQLPVGYADHTDPQDANNEIISCLGLAMGFNVIEKHFTNKPGEKRIDGQSAVSEAQMLRIKSLAGVIWASRGTDDLGMSAGEMKYGDTGPMKKAVVARQAIKKGEEINFSNIAYKRTNRSSYVKQNFVYTLNGQKASRDIEQDEILDYSNVEFVFKMGDFSQFNATSK